MNAQTLIARVILMMVLAVVGCTKAPPPPQAPSAAGVTIDLPKLRQSFPPPIKQDIGDSLDQASFGIRYGDFNKTLAELAKLAGNPSLTEPQKKAVNDVIAQVKQALEKGAAGKPAQ
jgi:hypothetical protein